MVVLLGFPDLQVTKDHHVDWWTNKIGGFPNWFDSVHVDSYPRCCLCEENLYHLVQVYCPLSNSPYHRTLNIFGCTNKNCWNKPESILVLRSQELEVQPTKEQKTVVSSDDCGMDSTWCEGDDDWGTSADDHVYASPAIPSTSANDMSFDCDVSKMLDNLGITENKKDSLTQGIRQFCEYHLYVQEECVQKLVGANDYEMKLYDDYVRREGAVAGVSEEEENNCRKKDKGISKGDTTEKYEKTKSKSKDAAFHHFKKTISPYPGQLLRYDWCGEPLLLSSRSPIQPSITSPPDCPICQAKRVFELQLMPSLLNYLGPDSETNNNTREPSCHNDTTTPGESERGRLEFGCIYVFSCSQGCWEGREARSEYVAVQPDPDVDVLK